MKRLLIISAAVIVASCGGQKENTFPGSIETDQVRVSARVSGLVTAVHVNRGDNVARGQLLVKIDETPYALALVQSEAMLTGAEATLETLLQGTREQQILSAAAAVQEAGALVNQREADLRRARELSYAGAISDQSLQAAETAALQAGTRYNSAYQAYSLASEGSRTTEIEAAGAAVDAARAAVDMSGHQLAWTAVTSPLSGTVSGIQVLQGENVGSGMPLLTVVSTDTVKVVFYLPEPFLGRIGTGDTLLITSDGGEEARGIVSSIAEEAEFTPSTVETREGRTSLVYRIEGEFPNQAGVFKGGMPVDVLVETL